MYCEAEKNQHIWNDRVVPKIKMKQKLAFLFFSIHAAITCQSYNHRAISIILHRPIKVMLIFHRVEYGAA